MQVYALLATTTVGVAFGGVVVIVGVLWREMRRAAPRLSDSDIVGGGLGRSTTSGASPAPGTRIVDRKFPALVARLAPVVIEEGVT